MPFSAVAYALGALRILRLGALVQQGNAHLQPDLGDRQLGVRQWRTALEARPGAVAGSAPRGNKTSATIAATFPANAAITDG